MRKWKPPRPSPDARRDWAKGSGVRRAARHDGPARFKPYDRYPRPPAEVPPSGVLSLTEGSTAEVGTWLIDDAVAGVVAAGREEFGA